MRSLLALLLVTGAVAGCDVTFAPGTETSTLRQAFATAPLARADGTPWDSDGTGPDLFVVVRALDVGRLQPTERYRTATTVNATADDLPIGDERETADGPSLAHTERLVLEVRDADGAGQSELVWGSDVLVLSDRLDASVEVGAAETVTAVSADGRASVTLHLRRAGPTPGEGA